MTQFNIFARSIIVLFAIALIFISVNFEEYVAETSIEAVENPVERLFEITQADQHFQDNEEIFQRKTYAYLAGNYQETGNSKQGFRPINDTANRLVVAKNLARQKKYDKALTILDEVEFGDAFSYDVRILQAQINSSAGQYDLADQIFSNLREEFPHDPDLMVAYGHLFLDRGLLSNAESLFSKTLVEYPGYSGAQDGLAQVRQARRQ